MALKALPDESENYVARLGGWGLDWDGILHPLHYLERLRQVWRHIPVSMVMTEEEIPEEGRKIFLGGRGHNYFNHFL